MQAVRGGLEVAVKVLRFVARASVGRSWPAWASGTEVPTTAVLTTPARNKAKALFRLKTPALLRSSGDAPKAGQLRPTLALEALAPGVGKRKNHLRCEAQPRL